MTDLLPIAPPLSRHAIVSIAHGFRQLFALNNPFLPVDRILEHLMPNAMPGYQFSVLDAAEMGERHGYWSPMTLELALREDVYIRMLAGKGRDRMTAMHEVGHSVLHPGTLNHVMVTGSGEIKPYEDPEWQAKTFAAAVMMPPGMVSACTSIVEATQEFGVSQEAARVWARILRISLND